MRNNYYLMKYLLLLFITSFIFHLSNAQETKPLEIAVIGLSHSHVHWILGDQNNEDYEIVGIVEADPALAMRLTEQYNFPINRVYPSSIEMLKVIKPEAVTAFGSIYEHLEVVETFAPLGIHVMVEKPLSVSLEHAKKMKSLAEEHKIHLLTNYETTWYGSNHFIQNLTLDDKNIGPLRKLVIHDGHQGPMEIGINKEFLEWLADPDLNGGGAIMDFGCYGANLATWLLKHERPISISAITQQIKPHIYPKVDDEATIIVTYPSTQVIIQASWNWPYNRKDMEVYGKDGYAIAKDGSTVLLQKIGQKKPKEIKVKSNQHPFHNPFSLFKSVVREEVKLSSFDPSSLKNNMIVMEILEAAKQSAKSGHVVYLDNDNE